MTTIVGGLLAFLVGAVVTLVVDVAACTVIGGDTVVACVGADDQDEAPPLTQFAGAVVA